MTCSGVTPCDASKGGLELHPIVPPGETSDWDSAVWIGEIDQDRIPVGPIQLSHAGHCASARLLIWRGSAVRGFVQVPAYRGQVSGPDVAEQARALPAGRVSRGTPELPATVVVCTLDRPDLLRDLLASLRNLEHPDFELLVVDNNPSSGLTSPVLADFPDLPVRLVEEPRRGLSVARNRGLREARTELVAFTDDDVIADRRWLSRISEAFHADETVSCVSGLVATSEIRTPAQAYFDTRVTWADDVEPRRYSMAAPPEDPLFPLRVGSFGTGANFAVRRSVAVGLGGFDEALGAGTRAGGGEDIDMFLRIVLAGHTLCWEPAAVIWHRHRSEMSTLIPQLRSYGRGLGAWVAKLLLDPVTVRLVAGKVFGAIRHAASIGGGDPVVGADTNSNLQWLERRSMLAGPYALARGRLAGRAARARARYEMSRPSEKKER